MLFIQKYLIEIFQKTIGILPKERVFCTSTKFIKIEDFYELIQDVNDEEKLIKYLVETIQKHYVEKCKLLFFGVSDNYFSLYYAYFLDENDIPQKINENITDFLKKIIEVYNKEGKILPYYSIIQINPPEPSLTIRSRVS